MDKNTLSVPIRTETSLWNEKSWTALMTETILTVLTHQGWKIPLEVSVLLTDDLRMQKLNKDYRGKDTATNVLSFPAIEAPELEKWMQSQPEPTAPLVSLGDIVLAYETIEKEALHQGKSFSDHVQHLIIHSMLHLLGYDHEKSEEATQMEQLELAILHKFGINDPYD